MLEIFVNNQQILLKMCDLIFPSLRQPNTSGSGAALTTKQNHILQSLTQTGTAEETEMNTEVT